MATWSPVHRSVSPRHETTEQLRPRLRHSVLVFKFQAPGHSCRGVTDLVQGRQSRPQTEASGVAGANQKCDNGRLTQVYSVRLAHSDRVLDNTAGAAQYLFAHLRVVL